MLAIDEAQHRARIGRINPDAARETRDSGVARRAHDLGDAALRCQFPHERVLASAAADNQYFGRAHDYLITVWVDKG